MTTAPEHAPDLQDGGNQLQPEDALAQSLAALQRQLADALQQNGAAARELEQEAPPELVAALRAIEARNQGIMR